jgi:hypothetical protein
MPFDKDTDENAETQTSDLDMSAATAEISSELFGQDSAEGTDEEVASIGAEQKEAGEEGESSSGKGDDGTDADAAASSPQTEGPAKVVEGEVVEDNTEAVQEVGAPKTWTKEALQEWASIPDRAKQEIIKREEDFLKGIQGYKAAADMGIAYSKVVEPYAPVLAAENVDPVELFKNFSANHYLLSRGTLPQKVELAANLLKGYNIPLADLLEFIAEDGEPVAIDPQVAELRRELDQLKGGLTAAQQADYTRQVEQRASEVDAFAADPKNIYFQEVADDIRIIFEKGLADSLPEAYEKAIFANPVTRQKEIDRLTAERTSSAEAETEKRKQKIASSTADKVDTTPKVKDGTVLTGSMDDTLKETLAAIQSRG